MFPVLVLAQQCSTVCAMEPKSYLPTANELMDSLCLSITKYGIPDLSYHYFWVFRR